MTEPFAYTDDTLCCGQVALADIAQRTGTPCYVYSAASIRERYRAYDETFADLPHKILYAVKANANGAILSMLAREGAGFDIVSGGELYG